MEKIFEIASSITNPISLIALFFLILFLLYRAVISKVGKQEGVRGYKLLTQLLKIVALIAIVVLLLVFGLKAYEVYSKVSDVPELKEINSKIDSTGSQLGKSTETITHQLNESTDTIKHQLSESTDTITKNISAIKLTLDESSKEKLTVTFRLSRFSGADLKIGNIGEKIIIIKDLAIHWEYVECSHFAPHKSGATFMKYKYEVSLTKENDFKIIDDTEFKYANGELDEFDVDIHYPGLGVYTVWFSFEYNVFGSDEWYTYETDKEIMERCEK